jgi:hypothetical protein
MIKGSLSAEDAAELVNIHGGRVREALRSIGKD